MKTVNLSTAFGKHTKVPRFTSEEELREMRERDEEKKRIQRFKLSGVPKRYQRAALGMCAAGVREYANTGLKNGFWLVLSGPNGTGKTYQACAVANKVICDDGGSVKFTTMGKVIGEIYDTYGSRDSGESVLHRYAMCKLLVIDDFGKEYITPANADKLFRLIDERWANAKATIITTNLTSRELLESLDADDNGAIAKAIIDRIADSNNTFVRLEGRSLRR